MLLFAWQGPDSVRDLNRCHVIAQRVVDMQASNRPVGGMNLARDMLRALGLAAMAGLGTALASGLVVLLLARSGA